MTIFQLFKKNCTHERLSFDQEYGYCPDCGEYVENHWFLVRCSCCGVKRVAITQGHEIFPASCFCSNCGGSEYYIEELKKLNFVDINYATVIKITPKTVKRNFSQTWVHTHPQRKLLSKAY